MSSPTVRDGAGAHATVRERGPSATLREDIGTGSSEQSASFVRLPRDLASRFVIERELPTRGNEADLLVVAPIEGGDRLVVKLYRSNIHPKDDVQRRIAGFDPSHVVRQLDWGISEGRSYEVIEYAGEGSLADLMRAAPEGKLDAETLRALIEQVSAALSYLHGLDPPVVHRDVKPDNVLVRSRAPLDLVLTDFGLASVLEEGSWRASTLDRTIRYAAPEASAGQVSREMDWWSLGMMVAEAFAGRHPFSGIAEQTIGIHYMNRQPVPLDELADDRVRLLCLGLLTYDRQQRWGADEVARWLAGDVSLTPPVEVPRRQAATPFKFAGGTYGDTKRLAAAMVANWDAAKRTVGRADGLLAWLKDEAKEYEAWQWLSEIAEEKAQLDAGLKVTLLLPMLDPELPVIFEGEELTPERLLVRISEIAEGKDPGAFPEFGEILPVLCGLTRHASRLSELRVIASRARTEAAETYSILILSMPHLPKPDFDGWGIVHFAINHELKQELQEANQEKARAIIGRFVEAAQLTSSPPDLATGRLSIGALWTLLQVEKDISIPVDDKKPPNKSDSNLNKVGKATTAQSHKSEPNRLSSNPGTRKLTSLTKIIKGLFK